MADFKVSGDGAVVVGRSTTIAEGAQIVFAKRGTVRIGDYCAIGAGVKFVCSGGDVTIGDWTTLHDECLVLCGTGVTIGEHCWFGQNCVIDGSGGLTIGSGVRVGMYSQIWSHVAAGEQLEGCTLYGERPVVIENDVWLVGSCLVSSGVTVGERTVALSASNITKSVAPRAVVAGSPATVKPGLNFYRDVTLDDKWAMLSGWLQDLANEVRLRLDCPSESQFRLRDSVLAEEGVIFFVKHAADAAALRKGNVTVCCVEDKTYNKTFTPIERRVLKYLSGNKARFYAR